jgi:hypothetical protein
MALKEIAVNVIKENVKTNVKTKNELRKHKKVICNLAKSKNCLAKHKNWLFRAVVGFG